MYNYYDTLIRSPGRIDVTLSTKYLKRSRRANILYFKAVHASRFLPTTLDAFYHEVKVGQSEHGNKLYFVLYELVGQS
jgi:hypothetical protein